jgi:hypothetical protein
MGLHGLLAEALARVSASLADPVSRPYEERADPREEHP